MKKNFDRLAFLIISIAGLLVYSNTFHCGFYFDDGYNITENFLVKNVFRPDIIWNYNPTRFITLFTISINYYFGEINVLGYHIVNILIHILTSIAVYSFIKTTLSTPNVKEKTAELNKEYIALFAALLFAVHPIQTQAVTYIIQRAASMAALFYIASVTFYAKSKMSDSEKEKRAGYLLSIIFCLLGMYTKEIVFTLPVMIIVYDLLFFYKGGSVFNKRYIPFVLMLPIIPITIKFLSPGAVKEVSQASSQITAYSYFFTQFKVIIKYIQLVFLPVNQNLDYDFPVSQNFFEPYTLISFLLLALLFAFSLYWIKKDRIVSFGILWFFISLAVESSILPIRDVIFEHRMYLPMAGVSFLLVYLISKSLSQKFSKPLLITGSIIVIILGAAAFQRNKVWADEYTLWNDVAQKSPNKARVYSNRGVALLNLKRYDEAINDFNKTLSLNKNFKNAYFNRGSVYYYKKEYDKAIADFSKTISLDSTYAFAYNNLGAILLERRKFSEAVSYFDNAIKNDTNYAAAYNNRGVLFKALGEYEKAARDYKKAIEKNKNYSEAYFNLGEIYMLVNNAELAKGYFDRAIDLNKNYTEAYYNRGNVLFMTGHLHEALSDYNFTLSKQPDRIEAVNNRGSVYFMLGRYSEAYFDYTRAIELNKELFDAWKNRGITNLVLDKPQQAAEDLNVALKLRSDNAEAAFYRAKALLNLNKQPEAAADIAMLNKLGYEANVELIKNTAGFAALKKK